MLLRFVVVLELIYIDTLERLSLSLEVLDHALTPGDAGSYAVAWPPAHLLEKTGSWRIVRGREECTFDTSCQGARDSRTRPVDEIELMAEKRD